MSKIIYDKLSERIAELKVVKESVISLKEILKSSTLRERTLFFTSHKRNEKIKELLGE